MTKPEQWAVVDAEGMIRAAGRTAEGAWKLATLREFLAGNVVSAHDLMKQGWTCTRGEWSPL
jgi:hypothetical protein